MRETYQVCIKCKTLNALLTYFLSKEENLLLLPYEKKMCHACFLKHKEEKIEYEALIKHKQYRLDF